MGLNIFDHFRYSVYEERLQLTVHSLEIYKSSFPIFLAESSSVVIKCLIFLRLFKSKLILLT